MLCRVINELDMKPASDAQDAATSATGQPANDTSSNSVETMSVDDYMRKRELEKGFEKQFSEKKDQNTSRS
ncbi:hypothetical protein QBC32DRAFT_313831 [Pseudoneurospora amorphoporcata]|uniref:Uncharacterized protein n=1 Tax=Pseudoneurospora amorphoporcata TaxID=241081 RepID=A0AAN6NVD7_9PEZI|nr:hypothetical protein QBC32DRAFT_313831 [Pseudoneurospora amorphoporcata]